MAPQYVQSFSGKSALCLMDPRFSTSARGLRASPWGVIRLETETLCEAKSIRKVVDWLGKTDRVCDRVDERTPSNRRLFCERGETVAGDNSVAAEEL